MARPRDAGGVPSSRELSHLGILEFANRGLIASTPTEAPIKGALAHVAERGRSDIKTELAPGFRRAAA